MMFVLANWKAILAAALIVGSFGAGWQVHGWKYGAEQTAAVVATQKAEKADYKVAVQTEETQAKTHQAEDAKAQTTIQTVIRYVKADPAYCGIHADSVLQLNNQREGLPPAK